MPLTHHLRLLLALHAYFVQHVLQLPLLLVHFLQPVLSVLFLGLQFLQGGCLSVQVVLHLLSRQASVSAGSSPHRGGQGSEPHLHLSALLTDGLLRVSNVLFKRELLSDTEKITPSHSRSAGLTWEQSRGQGSPAAWTGRGGELGTLHRLFRHLGGGVVV